MNPPEDSPAQPGQNAADAANVPSDNDDSGDIAAAYKQLLVKNEIEQGRANARRLFWTAIILGVGVLFAIGTIIWR
ncbi:hypothetical protein M2103_000242 [Ereboglobus sp. PH5-5]|uniref:hypothetical protein n=1 Tax=unclassified Ereboglobus TaxID=2626932 RepID=UPI0024068049|nr:MULTISPECIES: hypothetical protein [unclassified Ereboglobus]MDF9827016.1 hypothetical protein [Ereboglobus sp. PH5-10]MDF9832038.1 hypothetical protein [Ereboglobus sp. PH5-5]